MSNELKTFWLLVICGTILWKAEINHSACLTGPDLDAKIQQNFLNTATPTEKDESHD